MTLYIAIALFIVVGGMTKYSEIVFRLGILILFLLTALREPMMGGYDVLVYREFFEQIPSVTQLVGYVSPFAIGYTWLNALIRLLSSQYIVFQIVYSAISLGLLWAVVSALKLKSSEKCFWLFAYFCFHFVWNTWVLYRQNIATLLFWLFLVLFTQFSLKRQTFWKIVFLLLCMFIPPLFHTSAWANIGLLVGCWGLSKFKSKGLICIVLVLSVILFVNSDFVYGHLFNWITSGVDDRYNMYLGDERGVNLINMLLRLGFFVWFAWFYDSEEYPLKKMVLSTTAMMVLLGSINAELMTRMYEYYAIGFYTSIALLFRHFSPRSRLIVMPLFIMGFLIVFMRYVMIFADGQLLYYRLFF